MWYNLVLIVFFSFISIFVLSVFYLFFFFFFQAEDGIRDHCVTGVQTCALPIFSKRSSTFCTRTSGRTRKFASDDHLRPGNGSKFFLMTSIRFFTSSTVTFRSLRSEERRVGKECRVGWSRCHRKKEEIEEVGSD